MTHDDRVQAIQKAFANANNQLIASLERLNDSTATQGSAEGGWSPAQIGCHVALTNEFLSSVLGGAVAEMEMAKPVEFKESLATMQMPDKVKTFPALEPPAGTSRSDAMAQLRASADVFAGALAKATAERCGNTCVKMPFGAVFSIYEVGEFTAGHVHRHIGQLERTLATA